MAGTHEKYEIPGAVLQGDGQVSPEIPKIGRRGGMRPKLGRDPFGASRIENGAGFAPTGPRLIQNQGLVLIIDVVGIEDPEKALPKQGFPAAIARFDFVNVLIAHNE